MDEVQRMVRAACDLMEPSRQTCEWPKCGCTGPITPAIERFLRALIASTREEAVREEREKWMACALKSRRPGHEHEYAGWDITALNRLRTTALAAPSIKGVGDAE